MRERRRHASSIFARGENASVPATRTTSAPPRAPPLQTPADAARMGRRWCGWRGVVTGAEAQDAREAQAREQHFRTRQKCERPRHPHHLRPTPRTAPANPSRCCEKGAEVVRVAGRRDRSRSAGCARGAGTRAAFSHEAKMRASPPPAPPPPHPARIKAETLHPDRTCARPERPVRRPPIPTPRSSRH